MRFSVWSGCIIAALSIGSLPDNDSLSAAEKSNAAEPSQPLKLLLKEMPKPRYNTPVPSLVTGRVVVQSPGKTSGVSGVSVSDGYSVVKTDSRGTYSLKPDPRAVFINVTRPAGYDVQGNWYQPLAQEVNFELQPSNEDENEFVFIHVTDTHVSSNPRSLQRLSRFVREVNGLTPPPRFVVNSGDLLNLHKALLGTPGQGHAAFRNYVGIMNHLSIPHYNVAGDHTDSCYRLDEFPRGDPRCAKPLYWEYLGPNFFSFEYGKIHFVSVDYGYHLGQRKLKVNGRLLDYPTLQVQPMHIKWLQQDLQQRSPGTFGVTTSEHDLVEYCPGFHQIAEQHDVRLQLVGDDHIVTHKTSPVPYRTGGALAGCWWNPKANQLCPDLSPQGYLIYHVSGEQMDCFYKGLGQRIAIVSHRYGAPLTGQEKIQAHLVQPRSGESLEFSVNGEDWQPMQEIGKPFYRTLYSATVDTRGLPEGVMTFQVRSTATDEVRKRTLVVMNGGSPSPATKGAELTFTVGSKITNAKTQRTPRGTVSVVWNGEVVGQIQPQAPQTYSFPIPGSNLKAANLLEFQFSEEDDGMSLNSPLLTVQGNRVYDPRDAAIKEIRTGHWGQGAADWGGFLVGTSAQLEESPFQRKQNEFCFVLTQTK
jgi:hypothetical protein